MKRVCAVVALVFVSACRPQQVMDAGVDEDAGFDAGVVDAGRARGDDPLTGWMTAIELPADAGASAKLGVSVSSAPDQFGQPLVAGLFVDPNGDGNPSDTRLFFSRWDGAAKAFAPMQIVEIVGSVAVDHPNRQVSVSRDADTGRIGIAYVKADGNQVRFAWSDDEGANFSLATASDGTAALVSNPSLVMKAGVAHVAYTQGNTLVYRVRSTAGTWADTQVDTSALNGPVSLALDGAGQPALAYLRALMGGAAQVMFWRPGGASVAVADSNGFDVSLVGVRPSVTLTFSGAVPHVAFHLRRVAPLATNDNTDELFYAVATDATASTWKAAVSIPRNSDGMGRFHSTKWYQAIAIDAGGRVSIAADFAAVGGVSLCGGPKLARSANGTTFDTCAPGATPVQFAGDWLTMWPHKAGKQTLVFHYDQRANPSLKAGVIMWREP